VSRRHAHLQDTPPLAPCSETVLALRSVSERFLTVGPSLPNPANLSEQRQLVEVATLGTRSTRVCSHYDSREAGDSLATAGVVIHAGGKPGGEALLRTFNVRNPENTHSGQMLRWQRNYRSAISRLLFNAMARSSTPSTDSPLLFAGLYEASSRTVRVSGSECQRGIRLYGGHPPWTARRGWRRRDTGARWKVLFMIVVLPGGAARTLDQS
jgi:hypothetical protein